MEREADYATRNWWKATDESERAWETWLDLSKATTIRFATGPDKAMHAEIWAGQYYRVEGEDALRLRAYLLAQQAQTPGAGAEVAMLETRLAALEQWKQRQEGDGR